MACPPRMDRRCIKFTTRTLVRLRGRVGVRICQTEGKCFISLMVMNTAHTTPVIPHIITNRNRRSITPRIVTNNKPSPICPNRRCSLNKMIKLSPTRGREPPGAAHPTWLMGTLGRAGAAMAMEALAMAMAA